MAEQTEQTQVEQQLEAQEREQAQIAAMDAISKADRFLLIIDDDKVFSNPEMTCAEAVGVMHFARKEMERRLRA